ncbi:hypothetical protein NLX85_19610 [Micromonospora sp. A3M-1-15]|uniref:hypothetical protein n=1 Tax=Micromonospora sp. A3M-1-15 TaxID=2962035 RepID=UPI0020B81EC0|nr:hypothetical protein [Micromonospora sp. A3M-1-15]MCP3785572.1 hypothetical protein [Micromonospora sp. A3M-1-15]
MPRTQETAPSRGRPARRIVEPAVLAAGTTDARSINDIAYAVSQPDTVDVNEIVMRSTAQG